MRSVAFSTAGKRPSTRRVVIAWAVAGLALLASVSSLRTWAATPIDVLTLVTMPLAFGGIGAFLSVRVPGNPIGPMLLAAAVGFSTLIASGAYVVATFEGAPAAPATMVAGLLANLTFIPSLVLVIVGVPLVFPDGRFLSPRWRWVALISALVVVIAEAAILFGQPTLSEGFELANPFYVASVAPTLGALNNLTSLAAVPLFVLAWASVVIRYRRSDDAGRQQIRWLAATSAVALAAYGLSFFSPTDFGPFLEAVGILALNAIPLAIGIAVVRYRLYEIDRLISRGISYGLVTVVLLGTYVAAVLVLQGPLGAWFGTQTVTVAISTLVVAGLFQPVRSRIQRAVDRRFDRARFDTERTAAAFSDRLRDEVDIDAVIGDLATTASGAVRPARINVWLRGPAVPS
jgi:hypothetical protein